MAFSTTKNAFELFETQHQTSLETFLGLIVTLIKDAQEDSQKNSLADFEISDTRDFCIKLTTIINVILDVADKHKNAYQSDSKSFVQQQTTQSVDKLRKLIEENKDSFDNIRGIINSKIETANAINDCTKLLNLINELISIKNALITNECDIDFKN